MLVVHQGVGVVLVIRAFDRSQKFNKEVFELLFGSQTIRFSRLVWQGFNGQGKARFCWWRWCFRPIWLQPFNCCGDGSELRLIVEVIIERWQGCGTYRCIHRWMLRAVLVWVALIVVDVYIDSSVGCGL